MTVLIVLLSLALLVFLVLSTPIGLYIRYDGTFSVKFGIWFLKFPIVPKKEKKRKTPRLSAFTYEKHKKRLLSERRKAEKKAAKKTKKKQKSEKIKDKASETANQAKKPLGERLTSVFDFVKFVLGEFPRLASYIRTEIKTAHISVGTGDAAKTAELYGAVCAGLSLLIELLGRKTRLRKIKKDAVSVSADFLGDKSVAQLDISMKISVFSVLRAGCHTLAWFIGKKVAQAANKVRNNK